MQQQRPTITIRHLKQLQLPNGLQLRPRGPTDETFLEQLYQSTREDLQALGPAADALIQLQYQAKTQSYRQTYPQAIELVLEKHHQAVGQVTLNLEPQVLRLIELSLLPAERHQGLGKAVLKAIQQYAAQKAAPIMLSVNQHNLAAKGLYSTLGFHTQAVEPPNEQMRWHPE